MQVRRAVLEAIADHARRESPRECCGLLIGTAAEITEAVAAVNVAADPLRHYEISPADHLAQIRRCRALAASGRAGLGIVGGYHSHPHSAPTPSPTDREQAFEEFLYLIAGHADAGTPVEVRAYRLRNGLFEPEALSVV